MIVATRPDPTVRPPSRYQTCVLLQPADVFRYVRVGFEFCYYGVITLSVRPNICYLIIFYFHSFFNT